MQINTPRPFRASPAPVPPVSAYKRAAPVYLAPHHIARLSWLLAYVAQVVPTDEADLLGGHGSLAAALDAEALLLVERLRPLPQMTRAEQYEQASVRG